ncbi:hypothetical protein D5278_13825 [bacterium 1XD21-13]|nr:hypothetical protein [bacterium 1XD21-13]
MVSEDLKEQYWSLIRRTRKSGRVAQSVIDRVEKSWEAFEPEVVEEALRIHTMRYPEYKENYTIGIMRNLQKQKAAGQPVKQKEKNKFFNFEQHGYDIKELERRLIKR